MIRIRTNNRQLWENRYSLWDFRPDETLLATYFLLSYKGGDQEDDAFPLYQLHFSAHEAYHFIKMHIEAVIVHHTPESLDAPYPYFYGWKEFEEALESLCGRMGWQYDRERGALALKPEKVAKP